MAEPTSRDQIVRRERGQGKRVFSCSADNEKDGQPYAVDLYTASSKHDDLYTASSKHDDLQTASSKHDDLQIHC